MTVLSYGGVLLDGAVIMFEMAVLVVLLGIMLDGGSENMSLRNALGSVGIFIARLLIASLVGGEIGKRGGTVVIVKVVMVRREDIVGH